MQTPGMKSQQVLLLGVTADGRRLCGHYTLLQRLGGGGRTEVWRARDDVLGRDVALKVLSPALARNETARLSLEREYAIASRLDHPSILRVYPPERDRDTIVLPMELAVGGDLRRLRGAGYLDVAPVLIQIAHALAYAHERGVIHRDLKSSNVLFDDAGRVRVADFSAIVGTALQSEPPELRPKVSPFTASPEHLRGEPPAPADDIYGLGALAFELLTGDPPHYPNFDRPAGADEAALEFAPVHRAPARLAELILRMLSKEPRLRPASIREVIDHLEATLNDTLTIDFDEFIELQPDQLPLRPAPPEEEGAQAEPITTAQTSAENSAPNTLRTERDEGPLESAIGSGGDGVSPDRRRLPMLTIAAAAALLGAIIAGGFWLARSGGVELPQQTVSSAPAAAPPTSPAVRDPSAEVARDSEAPSSIAPPNLPAESAASTESPRVPESATQNPPSAEARATNVPAPASSSEGRSSTDAAQRRASAKADGAADNRNVPARAQSGAEREAERTAPRATADFYRSAIDAGLTALAAGRMEEARIAFEVAQSIRPDGPEAAEGLRRVSAALNGRSIAALRARATELEAEERWSEAIKEYEAALSIDPAQDFAREGRDRSAARAELTGRLQAYLDQPARLRSERAQALQAIDEARNQRPIGPALRSQITRLDALLVAAAGSDTAAADAEPIRLVGQHQLPNAELYYPHSSRRRGEAGAAQVRACVDVNGRIEGSPSVVQSSGYPALDEGALRLVQAGQFAKAMRGGRPISNCYTFRVVFSLVE